MNGKQIDDFMIEMLRSTNELMGRPESDRSLLIPYLYTADSRLQGILDSIEPLRVKKSLTKRERLEIGRLMEQLAFLVFGGLRHYDSIKSYASVGPQHDLLVNGSGEIWLRLCAVLRIDPNRRGILVEAKATKDKVNDPLFARLCAVIHFNFDKLVALGVFFTLNGATGFPTTKVPEGSFRDARLRQVMFYARCGVPIVVLDWDDIRRLVIAGELPRILMRKIAELEEMPTRQLDVCAAKEIDLPAHLRSLMALASIDAASAQSASTGDEIGARGGNGRSRMSTASPGSGRKPRPRGWVAGPANKLK